MVHLLMEQKNVSIDLQEKNGPLHMCAACAGGEAEGACAGSLPPGLASSQQVDKGASPVPASTDDTPRRARAHAFAGRTPLMLAAAKGAVGVAFALADGQLDEFRGKEAYRGKANLIDNHGWTALHYAANAGHGRMTQVQYACHRYRRRGRACPC